MISPKTGNHPCNNTQPYHPDCFRRCSLRLLLLAILLCFLPSQINSLQAQESRISDRVIEEIRLQGLDRLGNAEVLARMKIRRGDRWDPAELDAEYQRLWSSGDFISIEPAVIDETPTGVIITIQLRERRPIHEIRFEGADNLSEFATLQLLRSSEDELYDPLLVREDIETIRNELLEDGHPFARVSSRIDVSEQGLKVVFELDEGPEVLIKTVDLKGSGSIPISDIFKVMKLRTRAFGGLVRGGKFDPRLLEDDLARIREYYVAKGFFDAEVTLGQLEFTNELNDLRIQIDVEEGPRYRIGTIEFEIEGTQVIAEDALRAALQIQEGDDWDGEQVQKDGDEVKKLYSEIGHLEASVSPSLTYPLEGHDIILTYRITEGVELFAGEIELRGNSSTRDDVIRRQLEIYPGEKLHPDEIQVSLSNLYRLNYFDRITPQFAGGENPNQRPLLFQLSEQSTGRALFGVGYSSGRGAVGNLSIEKRNFDISDFPSSLSELPGAFTGAGQHLVLEAQPGTQYSRYRVQFTEPYLMGSRNSLQVSAFRSVLLRQQYIEDRDSGGFTIGRLFSVEEKLRGKVGLRRDSISVNDVPITAPTVIADSAGRTRYNALDLDFDWDKRVYRPVLGAVDGWYLESGYSHIGGPLGGDIEIAKFNIGSGIFHTIFKESEDLRHVVAMRTSFNWVEPLDDTDFVPVFERLYLGGPRSLRGFDYRGAGPRENDIEIGGTVRHRGSIEYTWPLMENTLRGIIFTDFGNLADGSDAFDFDKYRVGVGGGVVLSVPIFGQDLPISITWTDAIQSEVGDRLQQFSFDLGWFLY